MYHTKPRGTTVFPLHLELSQKCPFKILFILSSSLIETEGNDDFNTSTKYMVCVRFLFPKVFMTVQDLPDKTTPLAHLRSPLFPSILVSFSYALCILVIFLWSVSSLLTANPFSESPPAQSTWSIPPVDLTFWIVCLVFCTQVHDIHYQWETSLRSCVYPLLLKKRAQKLSCLEEKCRQAKKQA